MDRPNQQQLMYDNPTVNGHQAETPFPNPCHLRRKDWNDVNFRRPLYTGSTVISDNGTTELLRVKGSGFGIVLGSVTFNGSGVPAAPWRDDAVDISLPSGAHGQIGADDGQRPSDHGESVR